MTHPALSCVPADSTGTHSLYTTYKDYELMFHVSTMLPYTPNNRQQVSRPQTAARARAPVASDAMRPRPPRTFIPIF